MVCSSVIKVHVDLKLSGQIEREYNESKSGMCHQFNFEPNQLEQMF